MGCWCLWVLKPASTHHESVGWLQPIFVLVDGKSLLGIFFSFKYNIEHYWATT